MSGFYKMDPAAWDFGTAELSLEEEAAYLRIVNAIHKHDAPVPNNDRVLAGLFRSSTRKARSLVDALVQAGKVSIEEGKIWNDRARSDMFHRQFVSGSASVRGSKGGRTRAENAAKALETKEPTQAIASSRIEENRIEYTVSNDTDVKVAEAVRIYNAAADRSGWSQVQKMTKPRIAALKARMKDAGGLDGWRMAIGKAEESDFLCGRIKTRDGPFFASFDFVTQSKSFTKLMEGNYDNRTSGQTDPGSATLRAIARAAGAFEASPLDWNTGRSLA